MDEDTTSAAFFAYHSIHVVRELFFSVEKWLWKAHSEPEMEKINSFSFL